MNFDIFSAFLAYALENKTTEYGGCKILTNPTYSVCYSEKYNIPLEGIATIYKEDIDRINLKKRPAFKVDKRAPQVTPQDYVKSGFDKGHFVANDSDFDYSLKILKTTYLMTNITPQYPLTNRKSILKVEERGRQLARQYSEVQIKVKVILDLKDPKFLKSRNTTILVPAAYQYKYNYSKNQSANNYSKNQSECYSIPNDNKIYNLNTLKMDCSMFKDFSL